MESWRPVRGTDRYEVSSLGHVRSIRGGRIMALTGGQSGYLRVRLTLPDGTRTNSAVHRLVAQAFLPNPDGKPEVNHLDGNRKNNRVENLEWCTRRENLWHASLMGVLSRRPIPVDAVRMETGEARSYGSVRQACLDLRVPESTVRDILRGDRRQTHGYTFRRRGVVECP